MCNYYLINFDKFPAGGGQFFARSEQARSTAGGGQNT